MGRKGWCLENVIEERWDFTQESLDLLVQGKGRPSVVDEPVVSHIEGSI